MNTTTSTTTTTTTIDPLADWPDTPIDDDPLAPEPTGSGATFRPKPEWIVGKCPWCGDDLVKNDYYVGGRGYIRRVECWGSLAWPKTCDYRQVM